MKAGMSAVDAIAALTQLRSYVKTGQISPSTAKYMICALAMIRAASDSNGVLHPLEQAKLGQRAATVLNSLPQGLSDLQLLKASARVILNEKGKALASLDAEFTTLISKVP